MKSQLMLALAAATAVGCATTGAGTVVNQPTVNPSRNTPVIWPVDGDAARIPNLEAQVAAARMGRNEDASALEILMGNPVGATAMQAAAAALAAGRLNPKDHEVLRNAGLIPHPGDGLSFTGIIRKDGEEPVLEFPLGVTLPDGTQVAPGQKLKLVPDSGTGWRFQWVRETTGFLNDVTTVRGFLGPDGTLTVREFAPGASNEFVSGRVFDAGGNIVVRVAGGDKDVIVDNPELARRLRTFLNSKRGGDTIGSTPTNFGVIMPGDVESKVNPRNGRVEEYHFKGMPEQIWLLNRLGRNGGRTTGANGYRMQNGKWLFEIQTPLNVPTVTVVQPRGDEHPFASTDPIQRHFMLGMIPAAGETQDLVPLGANGDPIPGYQDIIKSVRRFNATTMVNVPAMSGDIQGRSEAGVSIDRTAPINYPVIQDDGRPVGFDSRIQTVPESQTGLARN